MVRGKQQRTLVGNAAVHGDAETQRPHHQRVPQARDDRRAEQLGPDGDVLDRRKHEARKGDEEQGESAPDLSDHVALIVLARVRNTGLG